MHHQHFQTDETQNKCQSIFQEYKTFRDICQKEIHRPQAQNGKNIGCQHDERVCGYRKNRRYAVHRKYNIAQLNHD